MSRRTYFDGVHTRSRHTHRNKKDSQHSSKRNASRRRLRVEPLEERFLLAADPLYLSAALPDAGWFGLDRRDAVSPSDVLFDATNSGAIDFSPSQLGDALSGAGASFTFGTPILNFNGQGFSGVLPPDTVGDVGLSHYIQATNHSSGTQIAIYNKNDGSLAGSPFILDTLATLPNANGHGDPIVLYDNLADRWLLSEFSDDTLGNIMNFYLSDTGTPTSNPADWNHYQLNTPSFPDYPKITLWPDAYLLGTNESDNAVYALDRNAMLGGSGGVISAIRRTTTDRLNWQRNHIMPADLDGPAPPAGSPGYFLRQVDDEYTAPGLNNPNFDFIEVWQFAPNFVNPANSTYNLATTIGISDFDYVVGSDLERDDLPQPGTNIRLDALPHYMMWRAQYRNFGAYETLVGNFTVDDASTGVEQAGVRWFELRKTGGLWSLYQEGTYAPDATNRWMGAISMDGAGNIALAYNVTSTSVFPGIRYAGRLASDPLGTLPRGEHTLIDGSGSQTSSSSRWGDYSAMSIDPADDSTFWFTGEYIPASGTWATRIGAVVLEVTALPGIDLLGTSLGVVPDNLLGAGGQASASLTVRESGRHTRRHVRREILLVGR